MVPQASGSGGGETKVHRTNIIQCECTPAERGRKKERGEGGFLSLSIYQNILYRKKTEKHDFDLYNYIPHFRIII